MKTAIVTTTIYFPSFLKAYADNVKVYGHDDVEFIVIADTKTPEGSRAFCEGLPNCLYVDIEEQEKYLSTNGFTELKEHLPYANISRRNIGHLMAYERGADVIVMLDDDNLATEYDVVMYHGIVGQEKSRHAFSSTNGWFNVCSVLQEKNSVEFYARGYPPGKRWQDGDVTESFLCKRVAVNAGLWINDPDIDAVTRIERRLLTTGFKYGQRHSFALCPGTWSPFNCQNTAISRAALPSYFLSPYTGRHLDIWAGYITNRVVEAMGEVVTFGTPLANHVRSPHNLYKDLEQEMPWIIATDEFVEVLRSTEVTAHTYLEGFRQVVDGLDNWRTTNPVKQSYITGLNIWHEVFSRLGA